MTTDPPPVIDLLVIANAETPDVVEKVQRALRAVGKRNGVAVQARAKGRPPRELMALASELRHVTRETGALLVVNDRADVAAAVGADGVHVPENGLRPAEVRAVLGRRAIVGASCHDARGVMQAGALQATYVTLGPFSDTPGKGPPVARDTFASATRGALAPVLALGGISVENAADALDLGARGLAVTRAVVEADDPGAAALELVRILDSRRSRAR